MFDYLNRESEHRGKLGLSSFSTADALQLDEMPQLNHSHHCTKSLRIIHLNGDGTAWVQSHVTVSGQLYLLPLLTFTSPVVFSLYFQSYALALFWLTLKHNGTHNTNNTSWIECAESLRWQKMPKKHQDPHYSCPKSCRQPLFEADGLHPATGNHLETSFNITNCHYWVHIKDYWWVELLTMSF